MLMTLEGEVQGDGTDVAFAFEKRWMIFPLLLVRS